MSELKRIQVAYDEVSRITKAGVMYVYGGGHNSRFLPDPGYDCSGFGSRVGHVAGILGVPHVAFPLDTWGFEKYGASGEGKHLTFWVRDSGDQDHMFLEFKLGVMRPNRFAQAAHTGEPVGWHDKEGRLWDISTAGFNPRHWPGT